MSWHLLTRGVGSKGTFVPLSFKAFSFEEEKEVSHGSMFLVLQIVFEDYKANLQLVFGFVLKN